MAKTRKPLGWGSISLFVFVCSTFVSFWSFNRQLLGEHIVDYLHLDISYIVITIVLLGLSIILGWKFPKHLFSKSGLISSSIFLNLLLVLFVIDIILSIFNMVL
ncbi:hypothetical protein [Salibacterium qingdaonense]|uniref:Uncharacterized protein n=1 Tax=Salibacterium qingdaonense TaxID=266892 RepID=A0A1I4MDB7_9BACI|nr:hypothetical protein [Salibacterium qingdaonense]SFM01150.1 hypothetical protein SAMN04488054_11139 [Salibacterium qingdaonense]